MNCSDVTAADVDSEVMALLKESYEKAKELLSENREVMDKLAEFLIEKETITGKEFMAIFRREKGLPEPEEKEKNEHAADTGISVEHPVSNDESAEIGKTNQIMPEEAKKAETGESQDPVGRNFNQTVDEPLGRFSQAPSGLEHPIHPDVKEK